MRIVCSSIEAVFLRNTPRLTGLCKLWLFFACDMVFSLPVARNRQARHAPGPDTSQAPADGPRASSGAKVLGSRMLQDKKPHVCAKSIREQLL